MDGGRSEVVFILLVSKAPINALRRQLRGIDALCLHLGRREEKRSFALSFVTLAVHLHLVHLRLVEEENNEVVQPFLAVNRDDQLVALNVPHLAADPASEQTLRRPKKDR
jgi:hypothetical protein